MTADLVQSPALEPGVVVHPPQEEGSAWVVQRSDDSYLRVGADMGRLLHAVDGVRTHEDLARELGEPWTSEAVHQALEAAGGMQLLLGTGRATRRGRGRDRRVRVVPPLTVQFTLVRPERLARRVAPLLRAIPGRLSIGVVLAIGAGGLFAIAAQTPAVNDALGSPMPLWVLAVVFVGTMSITGLHEFGHGLTLARYGGSPSRIGIMLFYLMPVFFCDVSDGWRLPRNQQRVMVALAGIGTQVVIAGVLAIVASPLGSSVGSADLTSVLLLLAVATYIAAVLNLVPLVKFDGYIALMTHVDEPHLRSRAMTDARRSLARWLFGAHDRRRELPGLPWAVPFGLACMVFPLYLISLALGLWSSFFVSMGLVGHAALLGIVGYVGYAGLRGFGRTVTEGRSAGASPARVMIGGVLVAAVAGTVLAVVPVAYRVDGGYDCTGPQPRLAFADGADLAAISPGDRVVLQERGLVAGTPVGSATIGTTEVSRATVSLGSLFPIRDFDDVPVDASVLPLESCGDLGPDAPSRGSVVVETGQRSLGSWVLHTYVAPSFR